MGNKFCSWLFQGLLLMGQEIINSKFETFIK